MRVHRLKFTCSSSDVRALSGSRCRFGALTCWAGSGLQLDSPEQQQRVWGVARRTSESSSASTCWESVRNEWNCRKKVRQDVCRSSMSVRSHSLVLPSAPSQWDDSYQGFFFFFNSTGQSLDTGTDSAWCLFFLTCPLTIPVSDWTDAPSPCSNPAAPPPTLPPAGVIEWVTQKAPTTHDSTFSMYVETRWGILHPQQSITHR